MKQSNIDWSRYQVIIHETEELIVILEDGDQVMVSKGFEPDVTTLGIEDEFDHLIDFKINTDPELEDYLTVDIVEQDEDSDWCDHPPLKNVTVIGR